MNKNIRRKNSNVSVLAGMKYIFFCSLLEIFLWVFVNRERMVMSGCLEFPCGFLSTEKEWPGLVAWNFPDGSSPTWKFNKPSGIKKTDGQIVISLSFYP